MRSKIKLVSSFAPSELFTPEALHLVKHLHSIFDEDRRQLLADRQIRQTAFDQGKFPEYIHDHPAVTATWQVAAIPVDVQDRRVEITGPVSDAKMVINMLSPGPQGICADMAMLDFEDSMKPSWRNVVQGIDNVRHAVKGDLTYTKPADTQSPEKIYRLNPARMAHVMVRVRGLHLEETNVQVDETPVSAGLFDLVMCAVHTARVQLQARRTPMFYVPKCEHFMEARWWHRVFTELERQLDIPYGSLRTTFLIETLPAAFQVEPILFEIRDRAVGLNGGRWDKIFSDIKTLRNHPNRVIADRGWIDMTKPWMDNYVKHLIQVCHKHGAFAMGGMSAFTPGKDEATRQFQTEKVLSDKAREASIGHDGCWVSHPYFIASARAQFTERNQLQRKLEDFDPTPDLLPQGIGPRTIKGLRTNIRVSIAYMEGWHQDQGCISFDNLMEDLATFEISRAQTWQWLRHHITLEDGTAMSSALVQTIFTEEAERLIQERGADPNSRTSLNAAKDAAQELFLRKELPDFLSLRSERAQ